MALEVIQLLRTLDQLEETRKLLSLQNRPTIFLGSARDGGCLEAAVQRHLALVSPSVNIIPPRASFNPGHTEMFIHGFRFQYPRY